MLNAVVITMQEVELTAPTFFEKIRSVSVPGFFDHLPPHGRNADPEATGCIRGGRKLYLIHP
jgi:hypothetical protein